jgi:Zn-dependent peptidase ImmA (M78 family)
MKKISTFEKGFDFEEKVFLIIRELLDNDDFFVNGKRSYIYRGKKYYSEDRKDYIVVDISIETFLEKADKYSMLTIIECKNYKNKGIPVDDIEEFDSKLNQLGEHNTKGIIITNSFFQKSAINIAVSKKIGLGRIDDKKEVDWINYRKGETKIPILESAVEELKLEIPKTDFISVINKKSFKSLPHLLIEVGVIDKYSNKPKYIRLPYKSEKEIEEIINAEGLYSFQSNEQLDTDKICKYLTETHGVQFTFDQDLGLLGPNKVLGKISFNPLKIQIDKNLQADKYRLRFTLAHEIGHLILHYDTLRKYLDENFDNDMTIDLSHDDVVSFYNKRLEIQANLFASRLLIPQEKLVYQVAEYLANERLHQGYLFLDNQRINIALVTRLLIKLQDYFFVSKEVARIRLINEGLLREKSNFNLLSSRH